MFTLEQHNGTCQIIVHWSAPVLMCDFWDYRFSSCADSHWMKFHCSSSEVLKSLFELLVWNMCSSWFFRASDQFIVVKSGNVDEEGALMLLLLWSHSGNSMTELKSAIAELNLVMTKLKKALCGAFHIQIIVIKTASHKNRWLIKMISRRL